MKITQEVKTAILVITGVIFLIFGFNYLKGENLLDSSRTFYVVYDNVEGLTPSTPVTINGLQVGNVKTITIQNDGTASLLVELIVNHEFQFSKNSTAELYDTGLIGGKAVAIIPAFDGAEVAKDNSFLKASKKSGLTDLVAEKLAPLQDKVEAMADNADSLLVSLNQVFDEKTKQNLRDAVAGLNETITSFKKTSNSLNGILSENKDKIDGTLTNLNEASTNISKLTDSLSSANISQMVNNIEKTLTSLNGVLGDLEQGNGSVGKLLKDEDLYNNLEGATLQLEQLLQDIKLNPKRYFHFSVFGKKPNGFDAGQNQVEDNGLDLDIKTLQN
ncbi:MlaD family protein [Formosa sp. S-31]|uniref:MlaD family protein n=1 Tax=Formosa sp. S-31 TaxID=2790949 RepID=UPI003EBC37E0